MTTAVPPAHGLHAGMPGPRSLTDRAPLLAAAAEGTTALTTPLVSEDAAAFRVAWCGLGVRIEASGNDGVRAATGLARPRLPGPRRQDLPCLHEELHRLLPPDSLPTI